MKELDMALRAIAGAEPVVRASEEENRCKESEINSVRLHVGAIKAEEGMGPALSEKRDIVYDAAVTAKWEAIFGDVQQLPE